MLTSKVAIFSSRPASRCSCQRRFDPAPTSAPESQSDLIWNKRRPSNRPNWSSGRNRLPDLGLIAFSARAGLIGRAMAHCWYQMSLARSPEMIARQHNPDELERSPARPLACSSAHLANCACCRPLLDSGGHSRAQKLQIVALHSPAFALRPATIIRLHSCARRQQVAAVCRPALAGRNLLLVSRQPLRGASLAS